MAERTHRPQVLMINLLGLFQQGYLNGDIEALAEQLYHGDISDPDITTPIYDDLCHLYDNTMLYSVVKTTNIPALAQMLDLWQDLLRHDQLLPTLPYEINSLKLPQDKREHNVKAVLAVLNSRMLCVTGQLPLVAFPHNFSNTQQVLVCDRTDGQGPLTDRFLHRITTIKVDQHTRWFEFVKDNMENRGGEHFLVNAGVGELVANVRDEEDQVDLKPHPEGYYVHYLMRWWFVPKENERELKQLMLG